jgi:hypothetical protein
MCANILVKIWYPNDKVNEVVQIFLKLGAPASYVKTIGPYATSTKDGMKRYVIYEFPDEKMGEAVKELAKGMNKFNSVVGFRWTAEIVLEAREALQTIGVKLPT